MFIFSAQVFYTALVSVWFYANRTYIANTLCINKNRPELQCKGKCYLCKKLKAAEESPVDQAPKQSKQQPESSPCTLPYINYTFQPSADIKIYHQPIASLYAYSRCYAIFHPPSLICS